MSSSRRSETTGAQHTDSTVSELVDEPRPEDLPSADDMEVPVPAPKRSVRQRYRESVGRIRPWSAWTLRAKLVASMLVLFTTISMITAVFTITALNSHLTAQLDTQLMASLHVDPRGGLDLGAAAGPRGPGTDRIIAQYTPSGGNGLVLSSRQPAQLTSAQLTAINAAGIGPSGSTVDLGSLGRYRMMSGRFTFTDRDTGTTTPVTYVVGLSMAPTDATIGRLVLIAISGVAAGLVLVAVIGTWLVRRNLEPLRRVAATATKVSQMPLHTGHVALAERVDPVDTDRRTEVGQVGAAFNDMLDHVDEALNSRHQSEQRVRQFVADASHELRTPLASIRGYAELSRRDPNPVPESVTHAMGRIESEADRMSSLVDDLLLLARLDAGRPLEKAPVDMSMLVINAVSDAHAASPGHAWDLDLPPEPVEVRGDAARLHQVVANLLANARSHTPDGTRVTTSVRSEGDWVRVAVHDDGPGVPAALQPNVFERFARGDGARNRAGGSTGLGLSIVAAVSKAHGGNVELASRPGDTTFSVLLPAGV